MKYISLGAFIICLLGTLASEASAQDRPNIILIMSDDNGFESVGANGDTPYQTPRLDALAAAGARFTHCYAQPLCAPSRTKIMTGRYNHKNYRGFHKLPKNDPTFGNLLRDAGYATCIVGKWQLGKKRQLIHKFGFDNYCLWWLEEKSQRYHDVGLLIQDGSERPGGTGEYGPDVISSYAMNFISEHKDGPFLLYYPMVLPHDPFHVPPGLEADKKDKSQNNHQLMMAYLDAIVGRLDDHLDKLGIRDNTILIYTSDNGTHKNITTNYNGRTIQGGKGELTDAGTHVPLIVSWPSQAKAGLVIDDLVDFSDFLPTLLDAAGAPIPSELDLDGRSFLPQVRGEKGNPRDWAYCWYSRKKNSWARTQRYKLYRTGEFFDIANDPDEQQPLGNQLDDSVQQIHAMLAEVHQQYGAGPSR